MLTEDNDPTKPAGVLDNSGNGGGGGVSSSTEASIQHPRTTANNGLYYNHHNVNTRMYTMITAHWSVSLSLSLSTS